MISVTTISSREKANSQLRQYFGALIATEKKEARIHDLLFTFHNQKRTKN